MESNVTLSGPMFEPAENDIWKSVTDKQGAHYNNFGLKRDSDGMDSLRQFFPDGRANELNFVLFSTSGVHGTYNTIEEAAHAIASPNNEDDCIADVTFLIVHPRICCLRHGNCLPRNDDDISFLKKLRKSSFEVMVKIGI